MNEMPDSRSIRLFTESLASIVLTVTNLPTSRRNSSTDHALGPGPVVDQTRRRRRRSRGTDATGAPMALPVGVQHVEVEELTLLGPTRRIADHPVAPPTRAIGQVPGDLVAPQEHDRLQVADVQRVRRRIEAAVERGRRLHRGGRRAPRGRCSRAAGSAARGLRAALLRSSIGRPPWVDLTGRSGLYLRHVSEARLRRERRRTRPERPPGRRRRCHRVRRSGRPQWTGAPIRVSPVAPDAALPDVVTRS